MKTNRAYLFRNKEVIQEPINETNINRIYSHLSADELMIKYMVRCKPLEPIKNDIVRTERMSKVFRRFD